MLRAALETLGGGYVIVQALMSDATGHSFADLMKRLVLDPARMRSSTYAQPLDAMHIRWAARGTGPERVKVGRYTRYRMSSIDVWLNAQVKQSRRAS